MSRTSLYLATLAFLISGCAYTDGDKSELAVGDSGIVVETQPVVRLFQTRSMMLDSLPVGAIVPYSPPAGVTLPENWRLCDGSLLEDEESPFNGQRLPNLLDDRFLMGASKRQGQTGGSNKVTQVEGVKVEIDNHNVSTSTQPNHSHSALTGIEENNGVVRPLEQEGEVNVRITEQGHRHTVSGDGQHLHQVVANHDISLSGDEAHDHGGDKRPRWFGVYYIIKIK